MVTKDELNYLSWISRLNLTDEELEKFSEQIDETIKYIDVLETFHSESSSVDLQEIDLSDFREDEILEFNGNLIQYSNLTPERLVKGPKMV